MQKCIFCSALLHGTNTDSLLLLYRHTLFVWTSYCLLHVNGLLTMYGVMRPWVQGQPWYMRVKIGLCCTDDLISIFRGLGMEMTLFTFKCFVLAAGLLYLCLIPVHRKTLTLHGESVDPPNYNHSLQMQQGVHPATSRERERALDSFKESPSSFLCSWLDACIEENKAEADSKRALSSEITLRMYGI